MPSGVAVKMKLDTGALTSSLDARDLRHFKRDGKSWVRFTLQVTDANTDRQVSQTLERPVEHMVTVRGAGGMDSAPRSPCPSAWVTRCMRSGSPCAIAAR